MDDICAKLRGLKATGESWDDLDTFLSAQGGDAELIAKADWSSERVTLSGGGEVPWTQTCMRTVADLYSEIDKRSDKLDKTRAASGKALKAAEERVKGMLKEVVVKVKGVRRWYDKVSVTLRNGVLRSSNAPRSNSPLFAPRSSSGTSPRP